MHIIRDRDLYRGKNLYKRAEMSLLETLFCKEAGAVEKESVSLYLPLLNIWTFVIFKDIILDALN